MRQPVPTLGRCSMQVTNAITRQKKEEIVADLKEKLNNSVIVFGLRYKGLDVSCRGQSHSRRRALGQQEAARNSQLQPLEGCWPEPACQGTHECTQQPRAAWVVHPCIPGMRSCSMHSHA